MIHRVQHFDSVSSLILYDVGIQTEYVFSSFSLSECSQTYTISLTRITVENKNIDVDFTAIFDTGTSFTYLNDPAYTVITENVSQEKRQIYMWKTAKISINIKFWTHNFKSTLSSSKNPSNLKPGSASGQEVTSWRLCCLYLTTKNIWYIWQFNSQAKEQRIQPTVQVPFEYCYGIR